MSERLSGIVLAHSALAQAFVSAVDAIAGVEHGLVPVSNDGCDRAAITARLEAAIGGRPSVVFADMPGGSCAFSAAAYAKGHDYVRVVTGVNLAMLLDFVFHRDLTLDAAARRAAETGRTGVRLVGGAEAGQ
jgi:mannose/fructose-specific phosphotransferase system component IIA